MSKEDLIKIVVAAALNVDIDPALACAVVSHESSWDPWAVRYEPGFYRRYVQSMQGLTDTEKTLRATSFGLCQVMGQVAREQGFDGKYLTELCDPIHVIQGCKKLAKCLKNNSQHDALQAYNGGSDPGYADAVLKFYDQFAYLNSATRQP
jgi:soluble lytic murein transglycosylase-like protein